MSRATTLSPRPQEPACPRRGTPVSTSLPHRRMGWHAWLARWWAAHRRARCASLDHLWDAQREQVWRQTASSYRDFVIQERRPALRLAMYQHLALS